MKNTDHKIWTMRRDLPYYRKERFYFEHKPLEGIGDCVFVLFCVNDKPINAEMEQMMFLEQIGVKPLFEHKGMSGMWHPAWKAKILWDALRQNGFVLQDAY